MKYITILPQLKEERALLERSLEKSYESFESNNLDEDSHNIHVKNLDALIKEYNSAIRLLTT